MDVGRLLAERYEILKPLAEGAMSTVWVAVDRTNNVEVAIKTISLDAAGWRAEVRDRFMKEARLLARGKHEHLVAVRDVGETEDGFLYLVLDLLEGETLADRLTRETKIPWSEALALAHGITCGVAALHRAGIVHRDLKPANIVLRQTPNGLVPTIIDLGIGKASAMVGDPELCATLTATGQVLGTPQYMSYEQALGQTDIDARSDVWALGVILYEMLTGARPFEAPNTNAVLAAIRRKDVKQVRDVVPDVPIAVAGVIDVCLSPNRDDRFPDAETLAKRLDEVAAAPTVQPPERAPAVKPKPRPKFVLVLAPIATLVLVGGVVLVTRRGESTSTPAEVSVDVKGSVKAAPTAIATNTPVVAQPITSVPHEASATATPAPTPRQTASATRTKSPVSRVDEAGF